MKISVDCFMEKQENIIKQEKEKVLIELGLCEKEYSPDGMYSSKFTEKEEREDGKVYFRYIVPEITDEEWEKICKNIDDIDKLNNIKQKAKEISNIPSNYNVNFKEIEINGKSWIASIIQIIAWICAVIGLVCVLISCGNISSIPYLIASIVAIAIFMVSVYAFCAVLNYLAEICNTLKSK